MTRKQAEDFIERVMLIAMIVVFVIVATGIVDSIVFLTGNMFIFAMGLVYYKILDKLDERES